MADQLPTAPAVPMPSIQESPAAPVLSTAPIAPTVETAQTDTQSTAPASVQPIAPGIQKSPLDASGVGINFVRDQRKQLDKHLGQDKKIARYTTYALSLFILVLFAVVTVYYLLTLEAKKIQDATDTVKRTLASLSVLEKEYVVYAKKVKLMYALDTERETKRTATNYFYALVPTENVLRSVSTDGEKEDDVITFSIDSPDVFTVLTLLQIFGSSDVYDRGYLIGVKGLNRGPDGVYTIDGSMNYARATDLDKLGGTQ